MLKKIVIASHNVGKLIEIKKMLAPLDLEVVSAPELGLKEPDEPYSTFIENALNKARQVSQLTGLPALADDSGLCVNALQGEPGVYSARYAGDEGNRDEANNSKLLIKLKGVKNRSAYFYCCMVLIRYFDDPEPIISHGKWYGEIGESPSGGKGFGYDPLFYLTDLKVTAAQLTTEEKNALSHRAQALLGIYTQIKNDLVYKDIQ